MNNSNSSNTSSTNILSTPDHYLLLNLLIQVTCVLIITFGVIGNILVLITFLARWKNIKTYEMFIITLAFVDLFSTILLPCIQLHEIRGGSFRAIGSIGCRILYFLSNFCITVSSLILTMVSVERFIAVQWPFLERKCISKWLIVTTLFVALVFSASIYLVSNGVLLHHDADKTPVCRLLVSVEEVTVISLSTTTLQNGIPILIMTILYSFIVKKLYANSNNYKQHLNEVELRIRNKNLRKTTKLLIIVVIVFFVCVTPSNVFYIVYHYDKHGLPDEYIYPVYVILTMLMMSNACANPLIYGKLHTSFRKQVTQLFRYILYSRCMSSSSDRNDLVNKKMKRSVFVLGEEGNNRKSEVTVAFLLSSSVKHQEQNEMSTYSVKIQFNKSIDYHSTYDDIQMTEIDGENDSMSYPARFSLNRTGYREDDLDKMLSNVHNYIHLYKGPETYL